MSAGPGTPDSGGRLPNLSGWADGPVRSALVRRFVGLAPVLLLVVAVVMSGVIGLRLSHDESARSVADELGCAPVSSSHPQAGVSRKACPFHGDTIVILTRSKGHRALYPPDLPDNFIIGPTWTGSSGARAEKTASRSSGSWVAI